MTVHFEKLIHVHFAKKKKGRECHRWQVGSLTDSIDVGIRIAHVKKSDELMAKTTEEIWEIESEGWNGNEEIVLYIEFKKKRKK